MSIANGVFSYMPPKRFRQMEADLATISAFFAGQDDIVIVPNTIPESWLKMMEKLGFIMPVFLKKEDIPKNSVAHIRPWGWSPATHFYFKEIKAFTSISFKETVNSQWKDSYRELYSRKTSAKLLRAIIEKEDNPLFPSIGEIPQVCKSIEEIELVVYKTNRVLLKAPWSSSGRGLYLLNPNEINEINKQWISGVLKSQKYVMAEVYKDKVCDLSFQFYVSEDQSIKSVGTTSFIADLKGNYKGNYLHTESIWDDNKELEEFLNNGLLKDVECVLKTALYKSEIPLNYYGYLGVDCMVYREKGILKFQPCVEINLRYNMGLLALKLSEKIHPKARGVLLTEYVSNVKHFVRDMQEKSPCVFLDNLLYKGFVVLSLPSKDNSFITYFII